MAPKCYCNSSGKSEVFDHVKLTRSVPKIATLVDNWKKMAAQKSSISNTETEAET